MKHVALALCLLTAATGISTAAVITTFVNTTPTPGGTQFNYSIELTSNSEFRNGDYFIIYDFGTALAIQPIAGWALDNTNLFGPTPVKPVNDDPSTLNVVITRTGSTIGIGSAFTIGIVSPAANVTSGVLNYASVSSDIVTVASGTDFASGNVAVPAAVPEPSSVVLLGLGVSAIGLLRLRKLH